jgi:hypothetical protein
MVRRPRFKVSRRPARPGGCLPLLAACCLLLTALHARGGTVITFDGGVHVGEVSFDGTVAVRGTPSARLDLRNVLVARFTDEASADEFQPGLVLTSGTRIAGEFSALGEGPVRFPGKNITIPGGEVAWAIYQPFGSALAVQVPRDKTGALLAGGDFFEGTIKAADAASAKVLNPVFGPRLFDAKRREFHAVILRAVKPQAAGFEIVTRDGSRYAALDVAVREAGFATLRHSLYDGLKLPLAELAEIRASPTRYLALAARPPSKVLSGRERGFSAGASLDGSPLKLAGKSAGRGFESAAGTSVSWAISGGGVFIARVAPGAGEKLVFSVHADNRAVFQSSPLSAGAPPQLIRCAVPAAGTLTLRVEGIAGTGVWSEPVLLHR